MHCFAQRKDTLRLLFPFLNISTTEELCQKISYKSIFNSFLDFILNMSEEENRGENSINERLKSHVNQRQYINYV